MLTTLPTFSRWGIIGDALGPRPFHQSRLGSRLTAFMSQLTTLELLEPLRSTSKISSTSVQQLLRASPNLLHLKANLELSDSCFGYRSDTRNGLWACRKLRKLHIRLKPFERLRSIDYSLQYSRIVFACLVKCCPKLRDLNIGHSDLNLELEGGMCLLSELNDLEKMVLITNTHQTLSNRDLGWLSTLDSHKQPMREQSHRRRKPKSTSRQEIQLDEVEMKWQLRLSMEPRNTEGAELRQAIWEASTVAGITKTQEKQWEQRQSGKYCWPKLDLLHLLPRCVDRCIISTYRPHLIYQEARYVHG